MNKVASILILVTSAFVGFFAYNMGHTHGKTDMILEMKELFKGCKFED